MREADTDWNMRVKARPPLKRVYDVYRSGGRDLAIARWHREHQWSQRTVDYWISRAIQTYGAPSSQQVAA